MESERGNQEQNNELENMSINEFALIAFGAGGAGKSRILNMLIGEDQYFESADTANSGVTKEIKHLKKNAFGNENNLLLDVFDLPGVGDLELALNQIIADIKMNIGGSEKFDAALLVVKSTDYRITIEETFALKAIKNFFENFEPSNLFIIVTHCDVTEPTKNWIYEKLESFNKHIGISIDPENVIKSYNNPESLEPLIEKLKQGNLEFADDLDKRLDKIYEELPGDFQRIDKEYKQNFSEDYAMLLTIFEDNEDKWMKSQEEHEETQLKLIENQGKEIDELSKNLFEISKRETSPQVVHKRSRCVIF